MPQAERQSQSPLEKMERLERMERLEKMERLLPRTKRGWGALRGQAGAGQDKMCP